MSLAESSIEAAAAARGSDRDNENDRRACCLRSTVRDTGLIFRSTSIGVRAGRTKSAAAGIAPAGRFLETKIIKKGK